MASLTRWTWVWVNSGSWWWTGRPGMLRFMGSQRVRHEWATDLIWSDLNTYNEGIAGTFRIWNLSVNHKGICTRFRILRDISGGPGVRTPCFHCRDTGLIPGWGTKIPASHRHSNNPPPKKFQNFELYPEMWETFLDVIWNVSGLRIMPKRNHLFLSFTL